jgi:hypothetical protein
MEWALRFATARFCDPGEGAPATAVNTSAEGCTTGPGSLPAGSIFMTTETTCGELSAVGEVT